MKTYGKLLLGLICCSLVYCKKKEPSVQFECSEKQHEKINRLPNGYITSISDSLDHSLPCELDIVIDSDLVAFAKKMKQKSKEPEKSFLDDLIAFEHCRLMELLDTDELTSLTGKDSTYSVLFTGYYTPQYQASLTKDSIYSVPIWSDEWVSISDTTILTTEQGTDSLVIDTVFQYKELLYLQNYFDRYQLYLQGSALVKLQNHGQRYLVFDRSNARSFQSLHQIVREHPDLPPLPYRHLRFIRKYYHQHQELLDSIFKHNPYRSYYQLTQDPINSASGVELMKDVSLAVDSDYYQHGSLFIVEFPVVDSRGRLKAYQYQLMIAADVGSRIDEAYKFDVYFGIGEGNGRKAQRLNHYGRAWSKKYSTSKTLPPN